MSAPTHIRLSDSFSHCMVRLRKGVRSVMEANCKLANCDECAESLLMERLDEGAVFVQPDWRPAELIAEDHYAL